MEEGLVGEWLKREGEMVEKGEPLCEIETEKTVDTIEAPESGVLRKIMVPANTTVPVNQVIAIIAEPKEEIPEVGKVLEGVEKASIKPEAVEMEVEKPAERAIEEKIRISPLARKLAEEHKIDITKIEGTGPGGRIVKEDVLRAIEEAKVRVVPTPAFERARVIPLTGIRKTIAKRLAYSAQTAVHVPITAELDVSETVKFYETFSPEVEKRVNTRLSYTDILVKAVAKALREHPIVNSILEGEQIRLMDEINIGVAVAVEEGIIVPVIQEAEKKSIFEIAAARKELVEKARHGKLSTKETTGGTFTISNLGMFAVDTFAPIINPPESAILGVGRIVKKPVVVNDQIAIRSVMTLTLVFDHRVIDGAQAARFLQAINKILGNPYLSLI
jgi:pyruvate dehydrogenase E2 component (dihydrolipoamide acetyltransferase)